MFKNIRKQVKNERGLTLVELLAVIVILGIIAAIAIPAIGNIIANSKYNAVKSDAINVINAAELYYLDHPNAENAVTVEKLQESGAVYLENKGTIPDDASVSLGSPHALSTSTVVKVNKTDVTFTNATVEVINGDDKKGSGLGSAHTIEP